MTGDIEAKAVAFDRLREYRENNPGKPITRSQIDYTLRKAREAVQ